MFFVCLYFQQSLVLYSILINKISNFVQIRKLFFFFVGSFFLVFSIIFVNIHISNVFHYFIDLLDDFVILFLIKKNLRATEVLINPSSYVHIPKKIRRWQFCA